jgi:hypothetical protein
VALLCKVLSSEIWLWLLRLEGQRPPSKRSREEEEATLTEKIHEIHKRSREETYASLPGCTLKCAAPSRCAAGVRRAWPG